jgi:hypothetical protein
MTIEPILMSSILQKMAADCGRRAFATGERGRRDDARPLSGDQNMICDGAQETDQRAGEHFGRRVTA